MEDLTKKTVAFVDNGLFVSFARKVAPAFAKAYYWSPWAKAFVRSRELSVGRGFHGIEVVRSPLSLIDTVDLWVFLDQFHADLQWLIETKHGGRVWGARDAEELELYRWEARQVFKRLGLPVLPAEHIIGMDKLREHLRKAEDKWVKNSFNNGGRADMETWHHANYVLSEPRLDQLEYDLGGLKSVYEFIVEDSYPKAVEIGYDGYTVDGKWPEAAMQAFEVKGVFMMGTMKAYAQLAEPVRLVNAALAPELAKYRYRGMLSTEIRWGKERKPYLLDPCCRLGSPSNELLQELVGNWPEIIWEGAGGNLVAPQVLNKFACVAMVYSEQSGNQWVSLEYPKELDQWVKVRNAARVGTKRFVVPQGAPQNLAGVVGTGNTMLDALQAMAERARQVKGDRIHIDLEGAQKALGIIQEGERYGVKFSGGALPSPAQLAAVLG